jgi:L-lactate dehydrogenase complex protein LldG
MDSPKARILGRIRRAAGKIDEVRRAAAVDERLGQPRRNIVPQRGQGDEAHRVAVFSRMMESVGGTVDVLDDLNDVPAAIAGYLRSTNRPARIRRGRDERLANLPWHRAQMLAVDEGKAEDADTAALTHGFAGVAESGTIVQLSGPDNPTTLNFLPEAHIVLLDAHDLHASYEEVWTRLREAYGPGQMPRAVNMISGPSRTADIEQTIVRPAHGPKDMHVIIVRNG